MVPFDSKFHQMCESHNYFIHVLFISIINCLSNAEVVYTCKFAIILQNNIHMKRFIMSYKLALENLFFSLLVCHVAFLARLHFSAEELLLYPRCQRPRPHAKC